jgi:hypothetical protein
VWESILKKKEEKINLIVKIIFNMKKMKTNSSLLRQHGAQYEDIQDTSLFRSLVSKRDCLKNKTPD